MDNNEDEIWEKLLNYEGQQFLCVRVKNLRKFSGQLSQDPVSCC